MSLAVSLSTIASLYVAMGHCGKHVLGGEGVGVDRTDRDGSVERAVEFFEFFGAL